jgi:hypothetical protein
VDTVSRDGVIKVITLVSPISSALFRHFICSFHRADYHLCASYFCLHIFPTSRLQVVALWRYRKKAVNGAPFVYECSELVACNSPEEQMVRMLCMSASLALVLLPVSVPVPVLPSNYSHYSESISLLS